VIQKLLVKEGDELGMDAALCEIETAD
jgi:hypothetical protein